ncbi:AAA family ATPase [Micromonospora purpureochromogenes]|uniref:ATP-dependent nuclease n=1 Tax=Micromonospora purpureochromogenes TaxID=47872 RepID=UPI0033CB5CB1
MDVRGFRSIKETTVELERDVSVLIGENSAGKSNVIEAVRLLTEPLDGRRSRYLDADDVFRGPDCSEAILTASYRGSAEDLSPYQHAMAADLSEARFTLRYTPPALDRLRGQVQWVAGNGADGTDPQPKARERLRHVYLPALRDAARDLGSGAASGVRVIIESLLSEADPIRDADRQPNARQALLSHAAEHLGEIERHPVLARAAERVAAPLKRLTRGAYEQHVGLGFEAMSMQSLARGLRLRMADLGLRPREIAESGMGYANLLFIAHVLTKLEAAAEADLTVLLVEEPEAHLHPPLQALLMDYLHDAAAASRTRRLDGQWRGYVQVVVTSHAPSLAAAIDAGDLVAFQRRPIPEPVATPSTDTVEPAPGFALEPAAADWARYETAVVGVGQLGLPEADLRKLNRYLNATRSALLFSPRVVLVEGVAEALILPAAARVLFAAGSADLARFLGTVLVPIDGVDFEPYVRVLLTSAGGARISHRVAIITDGDQQNRKKTGAERIANLNSVIGGLGAEGHARVFASATTLEPELLAAGNEAAIWAAWRKQQPRAWKTAEEEVEAEAAGLARSTKFASRMSEAELRKGDFAQDFLEAAGDAWQVPGYMADALRWLTQEATQ